MVKKLKYQDAVKKDECALITEIVCRRIAQPLAILAYKLGLTANFVTLVAGLCWIISTPLAVMAGYVFGSGRVGYGLSLWFLCGFLWNAGYLLDIADGSLARMTGSSSRRGFYLDYVFHLLFKPAFLLSIGIGLYLSYGGGVLFLVVATLTIPANWSASSSAVEHVLCEEMGKGKLPPSLLADSENFQAIWLGVTDINDSAQRKKLSAKSFLKALLAEILSYYGQFTFFSFTVLADIILWFSGFGRIVLPVTTISFLLISLFMIIRTPMRVWREYKRIALSDQVKPM
ncbi:MAG: hypothetical protein GX804_10500 [Lentisphaerae bacterium]|jgi:phosphatidylglycerophosphate synthase|nr:hypothetical protein [Lentisphaerota bacterium]